MMPSNNYNIPPELLEMVARAVQYIEFSSMDEAAEAGYQLMQSSNTLGKISTVTSNGVSTSVTNIYSYSVAADGTVAATSTGTAIGSIAATAGISALLVGLGVAGGVVAYNLAPEFWTNISDKLVSAGKIVGDKLEVFFDAVGNVFYDDETVNIVSSYTQQTSLLGNGELYTDYDAMAKKLGFESMYFKWGSNGSYLPAKGKFCLCKPPLTLVWGGTNHPMQNFDYYFVKGAKWESGSVGTEGCVISGTPRADLLKDIYGDSYTSRPEGSTDNASYWKSYFPNIQIFGYKDGAYTRVIAPYYVTEDKNLLLEKIGQLFNATATTFSITSDYFQYKVSSGFVNAEYLKDSATKSNINSQQMWLLAIMGDLERLPSPNNLKETNNIIEIPSDNPDEFPNKTIIEVPALDTNEFPEPSIELNPAIDPKPIYDPNPKPVPDLDPVPNPYPNPEPVPKPDPNPIPVPKPPSPDPTPPEGGDDDNGIHPTPTIPLITNTMASGLANIFNPTSEEVGMLGNYLWSDSSLLDVLKIFQRPLDAIISLHKIYCTPSTSNREQIKLGYLPTGISSKLVSNQISIIDCGSIYVDEPRKNATDYPPYTDIQIYLPFIGIQPLNGYDIVGSTVSVKYKIDVYTGTCIAEVNVARKGMNSKLYEFSGNCSYQIPLTSGNMLETVGNTLIGAAGGAAYGGIGGAIIGGAGAAIHQNSMVSRSGNLAGNAGILGTRIPYLIITRPVAYDASNYSKFYGYPANKTVYLKNCKGFTRVKDILLYTGATQEERDEIITLLKAGIII